jgi:hypothetical protein
MDKYPNNFFLNFSGTWGEKFFEFRIGIVPVFKNVSIRCEMNFYDKNTCYDKGISEQNEFFPKYLFGGYI